MKTYLCSIYLCATFLFFDSVSYGHQPLDSERKFSLSGKNPGESKGLFAINNQLQVRIFDLEDRYTSQFDISRSFGKSYYSTAKILGVEEGTQFKNGKLSPFSLSIWHQLYFELASEITDLCKRSPLSSKLELTMVGGNRDDSLPVTYTLSSSFHTALGKLCLANSKESWLEARNLIWSLVIEDDFPTSGEKSIFEKHFSWEKAEFSSFRNRDLLMGLFLHPAFMIVQ